MIAFRSVTGWRTSCRCSRCDFVNLFSTQCAMPQQRIGEQTNALAAPRLSDQSSRHPDSGAVRPRLAAGCRCWGPDSVWPSNSRCGRRRRWLVRKIPVLSPDLTNTKPRRLPPRNLHRAVCSLLATIQGAGCHAWRDRRRFLPVAELAEDAAAVSGVAWTIARAVIAP